MTDDSQARNRKVYRPGSPIMKMTPERVTLVTR